MKSFKEFKTHDQIIFESHEVEHLTQDQIIEAEQKLKEAIALIKEKGINNMDEGFLGTLLGGAAGFLLGPMVGRVIANALGIEKGIIFDMLTSRLVSTALGASIAKNIGK